MSKNSFLAFLSLRFGFLIFLVGKVLRFVFFIGFLYFLLKGTKTLAGYNLNQTIFFFLTFNLVDVIAQFLFRGVYRFRGLIVSGDFDLIMIKPISPLFRSLMGGADIGDLLTIPPLIAAVIWIGGGFNPTFFQVLAYILLVINGLFIATAFHIAVLALGIITLEIDHTIMIYRDVVALGRLPVDIYKQPVRAFLTYLIPVGIMVTVPAKALLGIADSSMIIVSLFLGVFLVFLSSRFWTLALRRYTSASS